MDLAANNALGDALVAYMIYDGSTFVIIQAQEGNLTVPEGIQFSFATTLSSASNNGYQRVSTSLNGGTIYGAAVWIYYDPVGMTDVIAAAVGSDTLISPPTSPTVSQSTNDFDVFTEFYNTVSWTASSDPNAAKYNVFRDGVYFTSTAPDVTEVIDHNAANTGSVTYGINLEDTSGNVSAMATIMFTP